MWVCPSFGLSVCYLPIEIKTNPLIPKLSTILKFPYYADCFKTICRKIGPKMKNFSLAG